MLGACGFARIRPVSFGSKRSRHTRILAETLWCGPHLETAQLPMPLLVVPYKNEQGNSLMVVVYVPRLGPCRNPFHHVHRKAWRATRLC